MVVREPPGCDVQRPPTRPSASVRLELAVRLKSALKLGAMETERMVAPLRSSFVRSSPVIPLSALRRYSSGLEQWRKGYVCRRPRLELIVGHCQT